MVWWRKPYINRRDWLLENQSVTRLNMDQFAVVMMIDYLNTNHEFISLDVLATRLALDLKRVDQAIQALIANKYLDVKVTYDRVVFEIDGLFDRGVMYEHVEEDVFKVFEMEFGRLLSQSELQTLNAWLKIYPEIMIIEALRSAIMYKKVNMKYINSILVNMKKESQE